MTNYSLQSRSRNKRLLVLGLLLLALLATSIIFFPKIKNSIAPPDSDAMMFGFDAQHTNFNSAEHIINPENVSHLVPYWIDQTTSRDPAAVANGVVYVASQYSSAVEAVDAKTGKKLWLVRLGGTGQYLAVANGIVYIGCTDGHLYAFNAKTGTLLWSVAGFDGAPVVAYGIIYIPSDGELAGLDAKSGAKLWATTTGMSPQSATVTVADGIVYDTIGSALSAFSANTGKTLWSSIIEGAGLLSVPTVSNGAVYVGSDYPDGKLYAFDARTGSALWTYQTVNDRYSTVNVGAIADGVVYVTAGTQTIYLYALDAKTGTPLWTFTSSSDTTVSAPFVANGVLYISAGQLHALNAKTGSSLWSFTGMPGDFYNSQPIVVDGVVYVGASHEAGLSYQSKLYALHLPNT